MFRSIVRVVDPVGMVSVAALASLANAQISPDFPSRPRHRIRRRRPYPFFAATCRVQPPTGNNGSGGIHLHKSAAASPVYRSASPS
jgi:hypothetical protein